MTQKCPGKLMPTREYSAIPLMYIRTTIMKVMRDDPKQAASIALKFGLNKVAWDEMIKVGEGLERVHKYAEVPSRNKTMFSRALNEATNPTTKTTRATKGTTGKADTKTKGKGKKGDDEEFNEDDEPVFNDDMMEEDEDDLSDVSEDDIVYGEDDYY